MGKNCKFLKTFFCAFLISIFFAVNVSALTGVMLEEDDLQVLETKWFDIIFPYGSAESAKILSTVADEIYEGVYSTFGVEPYARMPIVFVPSVEEMNAHFTSLPYNHFVFYDTPPTIGYDESLAVFTDNMKNIFYHECVHAVTFNLKNKAWQAVGGIFGDGINPAYLFVAPGLAEGTAVMLESENGEGRLNDSYSMHVVRQAKIEKKFPAFSDMQGASSLYPVGSYYQFNGAFYAWLRDKFGMEKLARLWYKLVNFQTVSFGVTFKSVYKIRAAKVWKQFRDEYYVPDVAASPLREEAYSDLFQLVKQKNGKVFSAENKSASRYVSLTMSEKGFACLDAASDTVLFFEKKSDGSYSQPKNLFRRNNITQISLSQDGSLMAVSYISDDAMQKTRVSVFDMHNKTFFDVEESGLREAAVVQNGAEYLLVCVHSYSQNSALVIYDIKKISKRGGSGGYSGSIGSDSTNSGRNGSSGNSGGDNTNSGRGSSGGYSEKISDVSEKSRYPLAANTFVSGITDCGAGRFAYILKSGMSWSVAVQSLAAQRDAHDRNVAAYKMPDGMSIRSLSWAGFIGKGKNAGDISLYFSCATKDTLPRLAKLNISEAGEAVLAVQASDVSGGVFSPVLANAKGDIFYSSEFFRNSRLLCVATDKIKFESVSVQSEVLDTERKVSRISTGESRSYNSFDYYKKGIFLPFPLAQTYSVDGNVLSSDQLFLGATYASSTPWESNIVILSGGVRPEPLEADLSMRLYSSIDNSAVNYSLQSDLSFDKKGFLQTFGTAGVGTSIGLGRYFSLDFSDDVSIFYGRLSEQKSCFEKLFSTPALQSRVLKDVDEKNNSLVLQNVFLTEFSSIHKMGAGYYEYGGAALGVSYYSDYAVVENSLRDAMVIQNLGLSATVRLPRLLPITNYNRHTYNLPTQASVSVFPNSATLFSVDASVLLYSFGLEKAVPFVSAAYINRLSLFAEYYGGVGVASDASWNIFRTITYLSIVAKDTRCYYDTVSLRMMATLTPNFGMISSLGGMNLNATFSWRLSPHLKDDERFSFNFAFNYAM